MTEKINEETRTGFWHRAQRFSLSGRGALAFGLIGVIGFAFGIYAFVYQENKRSELSMAMVSTADAIHPDARFPAVALTLGGKSLNPSTAAFKVVVVRIWNSGDFTIKASDYEQGVPFGFRINSPVLAVGGESQSSTYLNEKASPSIGTDSGQVLLPALTLEPEDAILVRALIQKVSPEELAFVPTGKVAGLKDFTMRLPFRNEKGEITSYPTPLFHRLRGWFPTVVLSTSAAFLIFAFAQLSLLSWRVRNDMKKQLSEIELVVKRLK